MNSGSGSVTIAANTDGAGAGSVTQNATAATSTITSTSAVNITVNTAAGGTGNASLRTVAVTAGTLTVNTNGGNILYAGVDALDTQQSALTTLAPGIAGPAPSLGSNESLAIAQNDQRAELCVLRHGQRLRSGRESQQADSHNRGGQ